MIERKNVSQGGKLQIDLQPPAISWTIISEYYCFHNLLLQNTSPTIYHHKIPLIKCHQSIGRQGLGDGSAHNCGYIS